MRVCDTPGHKGIVVPVCDRGCFGLWVLCGAGLRALAGSRRLPWAARERVRSRGPRRRASIFRSVFPERRVCARSRGARVCVEDSCSFLGSRRPALEAERKALLVGSETPVADSGPEACEILRRFRPYPRLPAMPGRASGPSPQTAFMT